MTYIQAQFNVATITTDYQPPIIPDRPINSDLASFFTELGRFLSSVTRTTPSFQGGPCRCGAVSPPVVSDRCPPKGGLKVDSNGVITTPGGYKIEQLGQYEWKVTGPDGKWTRVWGDPHVQESDRSGEATAWDFKRDSTFLLPDGTRINVKTKPYNNMTITSELEVINGQDRVVVTDIDKGKGKVGEVTHDALDRASNDCGRDVFVMGRETDDWYFRGREIVGSNDGGESFKLGQSNGHDMQAFLNQVETFALRLMSSLFQNWPTNRGEEADRSRDEFRDRILAVNQLFRTIANLRSLDERVESGRFTFQFVNVG